MKIKLSGANEVEVKPCGFSVSLILENRLITDSKYTFNGLYYDDMIELATTLLKVAEEIK